VPLDTQNNGTGRQQKTLRGADDTQDSKLTPFGRNPSQGQQPDQWLLAAQNSKRHRAPVVRFRQLQSPFAEDEFAGTHTALHRQNAYEFAILKTTALWKLATSINRIARDIGHPIERRSKELSTPLQGRQHSLGFAVVEVIAGITYATYQLTVTTVCQQRQHSMGLPGDGGFSMRPIMTCPGTVGHKPMAASLYNC